MFGRIGDFTRIFARFVLGEMALGLARVLSRVLHKLEETVADANGPKEQAALDDLDKAIEALEQWRNDADENDASQIALRTDRIRQIMSPRPGEAIDALTGVPVPQHSATHGPTSPEEAAGLGVTPVTDEEVAAENN